MDEQAVGKNQHVSQLQKVPGQCDAHQSPRDGSGDIEKLRPADEIVDHILGKLLADIDYTGHEVAVMVNSSGATPLMELFIINNHVADVLAAKGIKVYKTFVGEYMTSLEMEGFSVSLLRLDDELKALLDAPADTIAFKA